MGLITGLLGKLGGSVVGAVSSHLQAKAELKQTKATAAAKIAMKQADANAEIQLKQTEWESLALAQGNTSWKDEFVTVILLSPVIVLFVGALWAGIEGGTPDSLLTAGERMIDSLNGIEGEYAYLFSACVLAALGIRWTGKRK